MIGVFQAKKKDGSVYFRSSVTYKGKHISLGSSTEEAAAAAMYETAKEVLDSGCTVYEYEPYTALPFKKFVTLVNFRESGIYIHNPILLHKSYFSYFLNPDTELKFDMEDLFYYSGHAIMKRGRHLFVSTYGMQENLMERYGIQAFAVPGKDYVFLNGDNTDFRYSNIRVINRYSGIKQVKEGRDTVYQARIHLKGDWKIGSFPSETLAAVAYNKALDEAKKRGLKPRSAFIYVDELNARQYAELYSRITLPEKYMDHLSAYEIKQRS
ncbi:MAG: hypothetical protein K6F35_09205 [Lachnospiraceae bacterium]|nr:hypothetical protein [Lachnospiraceae bacterium]